MRVRIGIVGVIGFGLSVTVALAQQPQRRATLLPPQPLEKDELPAVARGAAEGLPTFPDSTPVNRGAPRSGAGGLSPAGGPGWLSGTASDGGVQPAGGIVGAEKQSARPLTPPGGQRNERSLVSQGLDKLKNTFGDKAPPTGRPGAHPGAPAGADGEPTNPNAFRGTTANGAPVYAGPPAYRWYGWGTVTPGANPLAPTGHYPKASANWYAITGATPGAFPVPVMNPARPAPGTEPPVYVSTPGQRPAPPTQPISHHAPPPVRRPPAAAATPEPSRFAPPPVPVDKFAPGPAPVLTPAPVGSAAPVAPPTDEPPKATSPVAIPTLTPPPSGLVPLAPPAPPVPEPVGLTDPAPSTAAGPRVGPAPAPATLVPPAPRADAVPPPALPPLPPVPTVAPPTTVGTEPPASPAPLPVSVTDDTQPKWQRGTPVPGSGEWNAPGGTRPQSTAAPSVPVARGQAPDTKPDPVATLIRKLCDGRAGGVDVRWTGTKKLTVCFEVRTNPAAQQLVKDISARPELAPYQIDFCVLVK
jgi:hypothetical protein